MGIKAVVFDFGGVIAFFQDEQDLAAMAKKAGIDAAFMKKRYWETRSGYDQGFVSGAEYFGRILDEAGRHAAGDELLETLVRMDVESWARINPAAERLVREVKEAGCKVAILSNMIQPFIDWARENLPVFSLVDEGIYSCEAGEIKPDAAIYRLLLEKLGCAAEETLFFDDVEANVAGARAAGIRACLWRGAEAARGELIGCGVVCGKEELWRC
ncbi:MAG: HAD family phosphatase [Treponema sp.]|jgi:putative hydrolase of the HAD superfamily|nr:HAD family phosphatase [Treponema sp.]